MTEKQANKRIDNITKTMGKIYKTLYNQIDSLYFILDEIESEDFEEDKNSRKKLLNYVKYLLKKYNQAYESLFPEVAEY